MNLFVRATGRHFTLFGKRGQKSIYSRCRISYINALIHFPLEKFELRLTRVWILRRAFKAEVESLTGRRMSKKMGGRVGGSNEKS